MICRILLALFALAYLFALFVLAVGTFGLFGAERDPLSAVYLMPLGMPWTLLVGRLADPWPAVAGVLAPALNLAILWGLCRAVRRGR